MIDGYSKGAHRDKVYVTNGCTNHSEGVRDTNDYYATPPYALEKLFDRKCLKYVYISSSRITCALNGDFDRYKESAVGYAWYIWQKVITEILL